MKNIIGTQENLQLFNKEGKLVYEYHKHLSGYSSESTYNSNGNELTFKNSEGYSSEYTYDLNFNLLTFKDSNGVMRGFDIPKEESKHKCEHIKKYGCIKDICSCSTGPKQETLEEAAERFIKKQNFNSLEIDDKIFEAILFGSKWQAELSVSTELDLKNET